MNKGGRADSAKQKKTMSSHVAQYYANKMKSIKTGNPMVDYCMKDVYIPLMMENM